MFPFLIDFLENLSYSFDIFICPERSNTVSTFVNSIKSITLDELNFFIAVLALLVAIYSVYYTKKCNRRKIQVTAAKYVNEPNPPIIWFTVNNLSPVPVTLTNIQFYSPSGEPMLPLSMQEPCQSDDPLCIPTEYKYAHHLTGKEILYPHSCKEFGYYFDESPSSILVKITSSERIHFFQKHQLFTTHVDDIDE